MLSSEGSDGVPGGIMAVVFVCVCVCVRNVCVFGNGSC